MNIFELDESLRTENPCWKGYKPVGTKKKNGRTVPNCVPKESIDNTSGAVINNESLEYSRINDDDWYEIDDQGKVYKQSGPSSYRPTFGTREIKLDNGHKVVRGMTLKSILLKQSKDQGVAEAINPDITNPAFSHQQQIGDYLYVARYWSKGLKITAYDGNKKIGYAELMYQSAPFDDFADPKTTPKRIWLESEWTKVDPKYQRQGIMSTMYAYAKMLGNSVKPSQTRSDDAKAAWKSWRDAGDVKYLTQGVAEGLNDTIYPNATVIKSKNGRPVGEIYQDGNSWGCFHYRADRGYDMIDTREEAIEALKDLHQETGRSRPDYTIKGVAEAFGPLPRDSQQIRLGRHTVDIERVGLDKNYISFAWHDSQGQEHYEEVAVGDLGSYDDLIKRIKQEISYQERQYTDQGVAEGGPFSYGAKKPRKGSVADLADKKRQEQERGKQPIEPKDQMVGVAKVTKGVAEGAMKDFDIDLQDQQWDAIVGYVINGLKKNMDIGRMELNLYKYAGQEMFDVDQELQDRGFKDIADLADHIRQHNGNYVPPTDFDLGKGVSEGSLNELSKDALKSYAKKAVPDMQASQNKSKAEYSKAALAKDDETANKHYDAAKQAKDRTEKRMSGVAGAIKRFNKEGVAEGFPYDVDHMSGPVIRNADMTTDNVKTKDKAEWDRAVNSINARVFDDMSDFRTDRHGERVTGNSAVWAKWDNATQTGWFNAKGRPLKPWPVKEQGVAEGSNAPYWRVEQSDATGRYYVVSGYSDKSRKVWKNKLGAADFNKKADAEAKANELNQGMAEGDNEKISGRYNPDDFDAMVRRLGQRAKQGPLKTVYDTEKRVYKNVPVNKDKDVDEASLATMRDYFAGNLDAQDPTKVAQMRKYFAKQGIAPSANKQKEFHGRGEYQQWLDRNKLKPAGVRESSAIDSGKPISESLLNEFQTFLNND